MKIQSISTVCNFVYTEYPKFSGCTPKVIETAQNKFVLIFKTDEETSTGKKFVSTLRVSADENGRITKTSLSKG